MEFGSILAGVGSILGSGVFGGSGDGIDVSENVRLSRHLWDQQMRNLRKDNIHPVYGLQAGQGTITPVTTGKTPKDYGGLARGASQLYEGMRKREKDPVHQAMKGLGLTEAVETTKQAGLQTKLMELQVQREQRALNAQPTVSGPKVSDAEDVHRKTAGGKPYGTRGGGVREDDLGGFWGEVQNFLYGWKDPVINPLPGYLEDIGKKLGSKVWDAVRKQELRRRQLRGQ